MTGHQMRGSCVRSLESRDLPPCCSPGDSCTPQFRDIRRPRSPWYAWPSTLYPFPGVPLSVLTQCGGSFRIWGTSADRLVYNSPDAQGGRPSAKHASTRRRGIHSPLHDAPLVPVGVNPPGVREGRHGMSHIRKRDNKGARPAKGRVVVILNLLLNPSVLQQTRGTISHMISPCPVSGWLLVGTVQYSR
jgi:hypothetical protein